MNDLTEIHEDDLIYRWHTLFKSHVENIKILRDTMQSIERQSEELRLIKEELTRRGLNPEQINAETDDRGSA